MSNPARPSLFASYLTPKAEVRTSDIGGRGVFAIAPIAAREVVSVWGGHLVTWDELQSLPPETRDHPVQIWHGLYLGPTTVDEMEDVDYFNHSCDPNCGVKGQIVLVAMHDIDAGTELTFDYGTTDAVGMDFECACGAESCRGRVTSDDWRSASFRARYRGYLSQYIQEMIDEGA